FVDGSDTIEYTLTYAVDPPPVIIRSVTDDLDTNSPVAPGFAHLPENVCLGAAFVGTTCTTTTASLDTFHNGTPGGNQLTDSVTFGPDSTIGISTFFDLEANGASSEITGLSMTVGITPEPSTYLLALLGLGALVWLRLKRARLSSSSLRRSD
ncbi:MAG TPA: PEP-CTERM sorting domain-containing protein, partial [Bryobacteraceae bacterium]|nr:PEP-CTERM sorting domain-containing protein [Bryobacteraceae bacterium]